MVLLYCLVLFTACGEKEKEARVFHPEKYDFHDGVAWVQQQHAGLLGPRYEDLICINEDGVEIFSTSDANINNVSYFYKDMALINNQFLINKFGVITHDLEKELGVKIKMFPDNYFDGFIFVETQVDGVTMTGILDENLEWIIKPTSTLNEIEAKGNFLYFNYTVGYYDVLMNEFIDEEEYKLRHIQRSFPNSGLLFLSYDELHGEFSYSFDSFTETFFIEGADKTGFYNKNYDTIIDLSMYPVVKPLSDFVNGKCLIRFTTAQKKSYVGLIDIEGKFLFVQLDNPELFTDTR